MNNYTLEQLKCLIGSRWKQGDIKTERVLVGVVDSARDQIAYEVAGGKRTYLTSLAYWNSYMLPYNPEPEEINAQEWHTLYKKFTNQSRWELEVYETRKDALEAAKKFLKHNGKYERRKAAVSQIGTDRLEMVR